MADKDIGVFFVGSGPELDTDEFNWNTENMSSLLGTTYGSSGSPLSEEVVTLTLNDRNNDNYLREDDWEQIPDQVTYDGVSSDLDASMSYGVTVTFDDGTTDTAVVHLLQDADGRMFIAPETEANSANNDILGSKPIESIRFDSLHNDGHSGQSMTLAADVFICFAGDTMITTCRGPQPARDLAVGDRVFTLDHGYQSIRWIGKRTMVALDRGAPVRFAEGSMGPGLPKRPLLISQQHRVFISSPIVKRMLGCKGVLIPAKGLSGLPGISIMTERRLVTYVHFLLDRHELVVANGLPLESLLPGQEAQKHIRSGPAGLPVARYAEPARPILRCRRKIERLVSRHQWNRKPLLSMDQFSGELLEAATA